MGCFKGLERISQPRMSLRCAPYRGNGGAAPCGRSEHRHLCIPALTPMPAIRESCRVDMLPGTLPLAGNRYLVFVRSLLFSSQLFCRSMGRRTWATSQQTEFLESFLERLEDEKGNHGLTAFYARITAEFIERWESPILQEDLNQGADSKRLADERRGRVSGQRSRFFETN